MGRKYVWSDHVTRVLFQGDFPVANMGRVGNFRHSISADQCAGVDAAPAPIYLVEMSPSGFLGVYNPDPEQTYLLLLANSKGTIATTVPQSVRRRRLLALSGVDGSTYVGIQNPVTCVTFGQIIFFSVTNEHYPVYDKCVGRGGEGRGWGGEG